MLGWGTVGDAEEQMIGHRVIQPHAPLEHIVVYSFYIPGVVPPFAVAIFVLVGFPEPSRLSRSAAEFVDIGNTSLRWGVGTGTAIRRMCVDAPGTA